MTIFGVTFSSADLFLFGTAGSLALLLLGIYTKNSIEAKRLAATEFRNAFDGVILNLLENPDFPLAQISYGFHQGHLAAIAKHRNSVSFWKRRGFDKAVENYKLANSIANEYGDPLALIFSEKTEPAKEKREVYSKAIHRLLSYA